MIEAYAFLAAFTMQILAMSVLYPARFDRYVRAQATSFPAGSLERLYPDTDLDLARERFLRRFRRVYMGIAVLGLLLLGWLTGYVRRPDWIEDPVVALLSVYYLLQMLPLVFVALLGFRFNREYRRSMVEAKRKAVLQRRGLFDFISPTPVFLAVSSYFVFAALVIGIQPEPSPGFSLIGVLTLVYALQAYVVYRALYGRKTHPLETHARRVQAIGVTVRVCVYSCIVCVVFFSFTFLLDLLDLKRWMPFALSVCLLITSLLCLMGLSAPPLEPGVPGSGFDGHLTRTPPPG